MSPHGPSNFTPRSQHHAEKGGNIQPRPPASVGTPVWFWSSGQQPDAVVLDRSQPWAGTICYVHPLLVEEGQCVNLRVTDHAGNEFVCHKVPVLEALPDQRDRHYSGKPQHATWRAG